MNNNKNNFIQYRIFKEKNPHFFVLNAGFDQAAGNSKNTWDQRAFMRKMVQAVPGLFNKLDGWASHSYPNHGFVGLPSDHGRASIRGYEWELDWLRKLGLTRDLPVFITETGWPHQEGVEKAQIVYEVLEGRDLTEVR